MACKYHKKIMVAVSVILLIISQPSLGLDTVRVNKGKSRSDLQTRYKMDIVNRALSITEPIYGPYEILTQGPATSINRAILEVKSGKTINTFFAITTPKWEENTLPIRIPIRRGILNFRLLAINSEKLSLFNDIRTLDELKKLKVGLRSGWATTRILKEQGFNVVEANTYMGLFYMLSSGRVDYIPRGMNEVYGELERLNVELPNLMIEPSIALHIPAPFYIFVSPNEKRLAERLTMGLEKMVENRELHDIFDRYYAENLKKTAIEKRHLLYIKNSHLPVKTPLGRKELWFEHD